MGEIAASFARQSDHKVEVIAGSSGKLYAQILNGAPFDVFLSADALRPEMLEKESLILANTRYTYAIGKLVLWSRDNALAGSDCMNVLKRMSEEGTHGQKLAIANPVHAPYGIAAKEFLTGLGLWEPLRSHLVYGENIAQAFQFAATGNASLAIVSRSVSLQADERTEVCSVPIPENSHAVIRQQAVQLVNASNAVAAKEFVDFLLGPESRAIILAHGYGLPDAQ